MAKFFAILFLAMFGTVLVFSAEQEPIPYREEVGAEASQNHDDGLGHLYRRDVDAVPAGPKTTAVEAKKKPMDTDLRISFPALAPSNGTKPQGIEPRKTRSVEPVSVSDDRLADGQLMMAMSDLGAYVLDLMQAFAPANGWPRSRRGALGPSGEPLDLADDDLNMDLQSRAAGGGAPKPTEKPSDAAGHSQAPGRSAANPASSDLSAAPGRSAANPASSGLSAAPGRSAANPASSDLSAAPGRSAANPASSGLSAAPGHSAANPASSDLSAAPGRSAAHPASSDLAAAPGRSAANPASSDLAAAPGRSAANPASSDLSAAPGRSAANQGATERSAAPGRSAANLAASESPAAPGRAAAANQANEQSSVRPPAAT